MKLPDDAIITPEKITDYLLKWRPDSDKSQFLARAGYTIDNGPRLSEDIREQILPVDAEKMHETPIWRPFQNTGQTPGTKWCFPQGHHHLDEGGCLRANKVYHPVS